MKIKIKREGGFIGITCKADLDYEELTKAEQNTLNTLAEQSIQQSNKSKKAKIEESSAQETKPNVADETISSEKEVSKLDIQTRELEQTPPSSMDNGLELAEQNTQPINQSGMMRDAFSYSISMKKDGKTVSFKFDDMTAPPEIVQIFQKYVQY